MIPRASVVRPVAALVLLGLASACESSSGPAAPPAVAQVTIDPSAVTLFPGDSVALTATSRDAGGTVLAGRTVAWSSSDAAVATVTPEGVVAAVSPGLARISATDDGVRASVDVTVAPIPVAEVVLEPTVPDRLVPGGTLQLTASTLDADGMPLADRAIEFESDAPGVAEVDGTGLVTARAPGTARVTATSEGRSSSVDVMVDEGGTVTDEETVIEAYGGAVTLRIPAGATAPGTVITVRREEKEGVPAAPDSYALTGGPAYTFGPEGHTFSVPVQVTLTYDGAEIPEWVDPALLAFLRWDGVAWHALDDVEVDTSTGTISGTTTGFSLFSPGFQLPVVVLNPPRGSVNETQRQQGFSASFFGGSLVADAQSSEHMLWDWSTSGNNGTILESDGPSATYLATIAVIPEGVIDRVEVVVSGLDRNGFPITLGLGQADVAGELMAVHELLPISTELDFDQSAPLEARVTHGSGDYRYQWSTTGNHGELLVDGQPLQTGTPIAVSQVTYHAKSADESTPTPPRVDRIDVTFFRREFGGTEWEQVGQAQAFMEVAGQKVQGSWGIEVDEFCASAYIYVPKVDGATSYQMHAHGFTDNDYYGTEINRSWSSANGTTVLDDGNQWKLPLSGACSANPSDGVPWLEGRFEGMVVDVIITGGY